jgi:hypothetical protein
MHVGGGECNMPYTIRWPHQALGCMDQHERMDLVHARYNTEHVASLLSAGDTQRCGRKGAALDVAPTRCAARITN